MEVRVESVSIGASVRVRIVLQTNRFIKEIANVNLTQAQWEDFASCLRNPLRVKQGRIVFAPVPNEVGPPARELTPVNRVHPMEAVA